MNKVFNNISPLRLVCKNRFLQTSVQRFCSKLAVITDNPLVSLNGNASSFYDFSEKCTEKIQDMVSDSFLVYLEMVSVSEEKSLLDEVETVLKNMKYQADHWDDAIYRFRECERMKWREENAGILTRIREKVFKGVDSIPRVHVLDLPEEGHVKPHVDSVRFCGELIAGLNLLSDAVMRLAHPEGYSCDVLLKRRSLYLMKGAARYDFTHEVLPKEKSIFRGESVNRSRRIALILRSVVKSEH